MTERASTASTTPVPTWPGKARIVAGLAAVGTLLLTLGAAGIAAGWAKTKAMTAAAPAREP